MLRWPAAGRGLARPLLLTCMQTPALPEYNQLAQQTLSSTKALKHYQLHLMTGADVQSHTRVRHQQPGCITSQYSIVQCCQSVHALAGRSSCRAQGY